MPGSVGPDIDNLPFTWFKLGMLDKIVQYLKESFNYIKKPDIVNYHGVKKIYIFKFSKDLAKLFQ
jgi:hypothetical protein